MLMILSTNLAPASNQAFLVKDIAPGSGAAAPYLWTKARGAMFFSAGDTPTRYLWKSSGTDAETTVVAQLIPISVVAIGGSLFFSADDGIHGVELWTSDGTEAGTTLVKDLAPGMASSYPANLTPVDGMLFFSADDGIHGVELWTSNGTEAGSLMVKDIYPGSSTSAPAVLRNVQGVLMFFADDGNHGIELWSSDGSPAGSLLVKDINPGPASSFTPAHASYSPALPIGGTLYFPADDGIVGVELWKSDGTSAGTVLVQDIYPGANASFPAALTPLKGDLTFIANDGAHGYEIWKSDGTASGTTLVKDIRSGPDSPFGLVHADPQNRWLTRGRLTNIDSILFFDAFDDFYGNEPWQSDGTSTGTQLLQDIAPGPDSSLVTATRFMAAGRYVFFAADDGISGQELWAFDRGIQEFRSPV